MKSYAESWRYNKSIFMLPPWQEIYETDNERKQDWKEAILTFEQMCKTYKSYGYDIVEIPKKSVCERADFVLEFIEKIKLKIKIRTHNNGYKQLLLQAYPENSAGIFSLVCTCKVKR